MTGDAAAFTLDHVIAFVHDLTAAVRALAERLGLVATSHATHPGFGTRNARIIFDSEHLEVLTEADPAELRASRYGRVFVERHARRGDGLRHQQAGGKLRGRLGLPHPPPRGAGETVGGGAIHEARSLRPGRRREAGPHRRGRPAA